MDAVKTGTLIAETRKERNLTQKDLAQSLHVSVQAVSKWERGLNFPDIALLEPLAELLGLTVSELMAGERDAAPGEELVRSSLHMGIKQLGGKARHWRQLFVVLAMVVAGFVAFFGYTWVRDNTEWLPQRETMLIPREIDQSEFLVTQLLGNDIISSMDTIWADDFSGFSIQLELWQGEEPLDCQTVLATEGYVRGETPRHNDMAFLMRLNQQEHTLTCSLIHAGAYVRNSEYHLPEVEIRGWSRSSLTQPTKVDREHGTILACIALDTGSGFRTITTGNLEKPNLFEDQLAVVLRLVVE